ncbi:hypothetical protein TPHA_0G00350 [Tetrapisispora phaffii CBS 4417]|uniref:Uncharacterized protein n=1 Tax=Tetrapisispora phaffii (strain ATCC 24235 / CBS 4417 / NBRC 1672 / NRRL Y-8282 / UCD 70-5) TaxID=1071381 RepID=G8BVE4_TETPH|nr:hypothetical protein TPHA_0G00350 [Tetrapisispora phaffii CBS 4417]CCE63872.1 hypothetical protein TPHA_0G00350 [Tetrapisispora phaffii CBS 4417]
MSENFRYLKQGIFENIPNYDIGNDKDEVSKQVMDEFEELQLTKEEYSSKSMMFFDYEGVMQGRLVQKMLPVRMYKDYDSQRELETYLHYLKDKYLGIAEKYYGKPFKDDDLGDIRLDSLSKNDIPEADTLEDSFLDMLIDGDEFSSGNTSTVINVDNSEDNELETKLKVISSKLSGKLENTTLFFTPDSFYELTNNINQKIYHGIIDAEIFSNTIDSTISDTVIILSKNYILNILPFFIYGNSISESHFKNILLQYWKLPDFNNSEINMSWEIVKNNSNQSQFVVFNKESGLIKFFKFVTPLHFKLINNLNLTNTKIIDCIFLPSDSTSNINTIFMPVIRFDRLVYFVVDWDVNNLKQKRVHQLTIILDKNVASAQTQTLLPLGCIPIGGNNILVYSSKQISVVSKNQILSGEINNFRHFNIRELRGIKRNNFFDAPQLLKKLRTIPDLSLADFDSCTIFITTTGNVCTCLVNTVSADIKFYLLTKFKGQRSICSVHSIENSNEKSQFYNLDIISFGRSLRLTLDLADIVELSTQRTKMNRKILSLNAIVEKHTLASSSEENSNLLIVPSTILAAHNDIWLTSPSAVSKISSDINAASRKLNLFCKLGKFQTYNKFQIIEYNSFPKYFRQSIFMNFDDDSQDDGDGNTYMILATDYVSISKIFILRLMTDTTNDEANKKRMESQLIEVEDLLIEEMGNTVLFSAVMDKIVQVTSSGVYVNDLINQDHEQNLNSGNSFLSNFVISGASLQNHRLIIYDKNLESVYFIEDITKLSDTNQLQELSFSFNFAGKICQNDDEVIVYSDLDEATIYHFKWNEFISTNMINIKSYNKILDVTFAKFTILAIYETFLIVIDNGNSQVFNYDVKNKSFSKLNIDFSGIQFRVCTSSDNMIIFYTANRIQVYEFYSTNDYRTYELKIPNVNKVTNILDVSFDKNKSKLFILFSDGLYVFKLNYFSDNISNFLLKSTRNVHKKFVYIDRMRRMVVLNIETNEWDCLKLSNGKFLSLNNSVLDPTEGISDDLANTKIKLLNMVVLETSTTIYPATLILLVFETFIKLVSIAPLNGEIIIKNLDRYDFPSSISEKVVTTDDGLIFVYMKGLSLHNETSNKMDSFFSFAVNELHLKLRDKLDVNSDSAITDFDICGRNIVFTTVKWDKLYILHDYKKCIKNSKLYISLIKLPPSSFVTKILSITRDIFIITSRLEGRSKELSQLSAYFIGNYDGNPLSLVEDMVDREQASIFEQIENSHFINLDVTDQTNVGNITDFSVSAIPDINIISGDKFLIDVKMRKHWKIPYQTIKFEKSLKTFAFDPYKNMLYLLTKDQSVIKYSLKSLNTITKQGMALKIYNIRDDKNTVFELPQTTRSIMINLDESGLSKLENSVY